MREQQEVLRFGPFTRDRGKDCLETGGERVAITRQSLAVLDVLLDTAGELVTKEALIARAWSRPYVTDDALSKRLQELRRALGDDARGPRYIETVPRLGFRFIAPVERVAASMAAVCLLGRGAQFEHVDDETQNVRVCKKSRRGSRGEARMCLFERLEVLLSRVQLTVRQYARIIAAK